MTREQFISHVKSTQQAFRRFLVALCCGNAQLADDIAQEAYIKAYMTSDSFDTPGKFRAWIYKIGYNTFLNCRRDEKITVDYEEAKSIAAEERTDAAFNYQSLYDALDRLPAKERVSIVLFYMENYSIKEIAGMTETSSDAVKQHLSRGRKHLRNLLTDKN